MCCEEADYSTSTPLLSYRSSLITISCRCGLFDRIVAGKVVGECCGWTNNELKEPVSCPVSFRESCPRWSCLSSVFVSSSWAGVILEEVLIIHFCYLHFYFPIRRDVFTNPTRRYLWHLNFWAFPNAFPFFIIIYYSWTVITEVGPQRRTETIIAAGFQSAWLDGISKYRKTFSCLAEVEKFLICIKIKIQ